MAQEIRLVAATSDIVTDLSAINSTFASAIVYDNKLRTGGNTFIWKSSGTPNGGTIYAASTGVWVMQFIGATYLQWFGAVGDGVTDCYTALQSAIDSLNGDGVLMLGTGVFYLNKSTTNALTGGIKLHPNAAGLVIRGDGVAATVIKTSRDVPRVFDTPGIASNVTTVTYRNITLENFRVDGNNIDDTCYGHLVASSATYTSAGGGVVNVVVTGGTSSYFHAGYVFFPNGNNGIKNNWRKFYVVDSNTLAITFESGDTIVADDKIQGALLGHVIFGSRIGNYENYSNRNINYSHIVIRDIDTINVKTGTQSPQPLNSPIQRTNIDINTTPFPGLDTVLTITDITIQRVRLNGGQNGIGVYCSQLPNGKNVFLNEIRIEDCYHTTGIIPSYAFGTANFLVGNAAFGGNGYITRCVADGSGDVGIETDGMTNMIVSDCVVTNGFNNCYYATNYNAPCSSSSGSPTATLAEELSDTATTMKVSAVPVGLAVQGYCMINSTELCYYNIKYQDTCITLVRGLNNTTSTIHHILETVQFLEMDKQLLTYINCVSENSMITSTSAGAGWVHITGLSNFYPLPNVKFINCSYKRATISGNLIGCEAYNSLGPKGYTNIDGFKIAVNGISNPTINPNAGNSNLMQWADGHLDKTANVKSIIPAQQIILRNIDAVVSGDLGNTSTYDRVYGLTVYEGNFIIDWSSICINMNFLNTTNNNVQQYGISFGFNDTANYISGKIDGFTFISKGNGRPVGIKANGNNHIGRLDILNLDFTQMQCLLTPGRYFNYLPYLLSDDNKNNVYIGTVKHPIYFS